MELKADGIDQRTPLSKMAAATKRLTPNYVKMLHENKGFVGPWCSDGACAPVAADSIKMDMAKQEGNFIQPPCKSSLSRSCLWFRAASLTWRALLSDGQGGLYEGMADWKFKKHM